MENLFISLIYQPFLNLLVFIYWCLDLIPGIKPDMGIAVIIFTLVFRIILLPLTWASTRSEKERRKIESSVKEINHQYAHNPIDKKIAMKDVFRSNKRVVFAELINFLIQGMIALMLWRIFARGLTGEDLHLLYPFLSHFNSPFNLTFLGIDLTHSNLMLNIFQSFAIFAVEMLTNFTNPYPVSRSDVIRLQLILPLFSFLIFSQLPAGKKLFITTSLIFTFFYTLTRQMKYLLTKKD